MPEPTGRGSREFLPSANQALAALEEATGKPVLIVDAPELNVLAAIRRAGSQYSSHVLRIKGGDNRAADYLIVFECRMALRDGPVPRAVLRDKPAVRDQVISECEELHSHLPLAKARELGSFIYDGLILQLRSMGPGLLVDRWIRQHCPDLHEAQEHAIEPEITNNLGALKPSTRANYPDTVYEASIAMNAAYALFGGDLLGKPFLAVPYISQGYGEKARRLIALALGDGDPAHEPVDRQIIDGWAQELGISSWYDWSELNE
ncbi:MAG: hypothetical protein QE276_06145 [Cyanobium sp. D14.bin.5]|nr:hypothetical protein [Cyanobium sp. D14.bin.5]